jgi:predicted phosphodiesterase
VIAIVGDTHLPRGSRALPARCVELLREASLVLHVGDLTAASVLEELRALAPVEAVHGNMDEWPLQERLRAAFPGCGLVAYGHTHLPEVALDAGVWIVNPGSPTERRRAPGHTIAVVREGRPELVSV